MSTLESALYRMGWLDQFARQDSGVHRIDPRAKVLATLVFLVCVVSIDRYDLAALVPFASFPVVLASESGMPAREIAKRLAAVAPFAVLVGAFNPVLDTAIVGHVGTLAVTGGMISWLSIIARFLLTTSAALILIATTGMSGVCAGLERLGLPDVIATQLLLLYRYLFVLADEVLHLAQARSLRSFGNRGMGPGVFANMIGHLLVRTSDRARRVYDAMRCRGFDGHVRVPNVLRMRASDWAFLIGWTTAFAAFRAVNIPLVVGNLVMGALR